MDLTRPSFGREELDMVAACLASGWVTQGPMVAEFERRIAHHQGARHALATTSCTAGLHLAAMALGIGPGDEVIVPAFTWVTSAHCAEYVGARVVFADVDVDTFNLDPEAVEAAISERTRAIVAVHLFGLAAEMDKIAGLAKRHDLVVIEDAACAVGTSYRGRPVGALGDVGAFSFHPRKVITTGEGGMVTTNDPRLAERISWLRNHGATGLAPSERAHPKPYSMARFDVLGFNLRMSDIQAAVGLAQMDRLPELLAERRTLAEGYHRRLAAIDDLAIPTAGDVLGHSYQSYVVRLRRGGRDRRNAVMEELEAAGVPTRPGTHAVHELGYYRERYGLRSGDYPRAAQCAATTITLPLFPGMSESDQDRVVAELKRALGRT